MCIIPVWAYSYLLQRPGFTFFYHRWQEWLHRRFRKPLSLYFLYELLTRRTRALLVLKAICYTVLLATFAMTGEEESDIRTVLTGWLVCLLLHSILVFDHRHLRTATCALRATCRYRAGNGMAATLLPMPACCCRSWCC